MGREPVVVIGLLLVGAIHLVPAAVAFAPQRIPAAYGVAVDGPDLAVLLRHRALLLGLVGALAVAAAFVPALRGAVVLGGLLSMLSFVFLTAATRGTGPQTARVARIDVVAAAVLALVGALHLTA